MTQIQHSRITLEDGNFQNIYLNLEDGIEFYQADIATECGNFITGEEA